MLVSVCIPVYNMENTIKKAVLSALNQSYHNLEILILDNQSTDKTYDIASSFKDNRLKVIRNDKNYGAYGNHNRCLELARGEWVKFLHGDDELLPECVERFVNAVANAPSDIGLISCGAIHYDLNDCETGRTYIPQTIIDMHKAPVKDFILAGNIIGTPTMTLIHRERLLKLGGFDLKIEPIADGDCWINLRKHYSSRYLPEYLVITRNDPPETLLKRAKRNLAFLQKNIDQIVKWHSLDEELHGLPLAETVYGRCLQFEMMRFWEKSIRYLMVGRHQIMITMINQLRKYNMLQKSIMFFIANKISLRNAGNFRTQKWPQTLKNLIAS